MSRPVRSDSRSEYQALVDQTTRYEEETRAYHLAAKDQVDAVLKNKALRGHTGSRDLIAAFVRSTTQSVSQEKRNGVAARAWRRFCEWL